MKTILQVISLAGIILTIVPPILFFLGKMNHSVQNLWMIAGAAIWFASASFWLGNKQRQRMDDKRGND